MSEVVEDLEPQADANASPDDRYADDKSVDTSVNAVVETDKADAEPEDVTEEQESEVESSPAVEEDDNKQTDSLDDTEYGAKVKDRIDKLTTNFRESEREADALREQLAAAEKRLAEVPQAAPKTLADFEYDEGQYRDYLFTEATDRATKAAEKVVMGLHDKTEAETLTSKFTERETAFEAKDYHQVTRNPDLKISNAMLQEMKMSDVGANMFYFLGKNPDEASRINQLAPRDVVREMYKLETTIMSEKSKTGKKVSNAPPPPPKIDKGNEGQRKKITDAGLSDADFAKMRRKQIAQR